MKTLRQRSSRLNLYHQRNTLKCMSKWDCTRVDQLGMYLRAASEYRERVEGRIRRKDAFRVSAKAEPVSLYHGLTIHMPSPCIHSPNIGTPR